MSKKQQSDDGERYEWHRQAGEGAARAWRQLLRELAEQARAGDDEALDFLKREAAKGDVDARRLLRALGAQ